MYTQLSEAQRYAHWLNTAVEAEVKRYEKLIAFFGDPREVFLCAKAGGEAMGQLVSDKVRSRVMMCASEVFVEELEQELRERNIALVLREDARYPELLREIYDPPSMLYVKGTLQNPTLPLAVIGARNCTGHGYEIAQSMSKALAQAGAWYRAWHTAWTRLRPRARWRAKTRFPPSRCWAAA